MSHQKTTAPAAATPVLATAAATVAAMIAFAANSLLARAALATQAIGAPEFTAVRLMSGAVALVALVALQSGLPAIRRRPGTWTSAFCLGVYALGFSLAYLRLGAATGALILFGAVQATMVAWGLVRGHRPGALEVLGLAVACAALVWLLLPGLNTPDPGGSVLMAAAGIAWGAYSLRGRAVPQGASSQGASSQGSSSQGSSPPGPSPDPLSATAGNFARAAILALPLLALPLATAAPSPPMQGAGLGLALLSGVVTSGLGYAVWYRALPHLTPMLAATVQLCVPVLAALGAVLLLGETLSQRLVVASVLLLGGIALAIAAPVAARRRPTQVDRR